MTRLELFVDTMLTRHRWLIHCFFWSAVLIWYALFFGRQGNSFLNTVFFVGLLMPVTIGASYFLNYFLVPRYLVNARYGLFVLYAVYTLIIAVFLELLISTLTLAAVAEFNIKNMSPASIDVFFLLASLLSVVLLVFAIKLLLNWRSTSADFEKLKIEKIESELRFLKTQLNPHFLFNTLNNLYYLTLEKSDRAPRSLLQLSEILDYVLYTKTNLVALEQELHQVHNYIQLESLHYQDRLSISTSVHGNQGDHTVPPMLLISLMENAFKHGVARSKDTSVIELNVGCRENEMTIFLRNSVFGTNTTKGGIGLSNLRAQLNLLYPGRHSLVIDDKIPNQFLISITLKNR